MPNVSWLPTLTILSINSWSTCTYFVYFKSKKELNYDRFVDLNILGAARFVHLDLRIYRISFFLLDLDPIFCFTGCSLSTLRTRTGRSTRPVWRISMSVFSGASPSWTSASARDRSEPVSMTRVLTHFKVGCKYGHDLEYCKVKR